MRSKSLELIVFLCGAIVMVFEMTGSRIMAPFLGSSIYIWTNLIGIIMASLSLGYYLGGRLADQRKDPKPLFYIVFFAGIFIGLTAVSNKVLLGVLTRLDWSSHLITFIGSLILFAPASVLLGMVSPYAIRLKIDSVSSSGRTIGNMYALSTVGSIIGTFAAGYALIPFIGTSKLTYVLAIALMLISLLTGPTAFKLIKSKETIVPILLIILMSAAYHYARGTTYVEYDTKYNRVFVSDLNDPVTGRAARYLQMDRGSNSAIFLDGPGIVFPYIQHSLSITEAITPKIKSALILGGGAFTIPTELVKRYPGIEVDVVEIDEGLTPISEAHFGYVPNDQINVFYEDAYTFLQGGIPHTYDLIIVDVIRSETAVPHHLTTLEVAEQLRSLMKQDGFLILNCLANPEGPGNRFWHAELKTYRESFPSVNALVNDAVEAKVENILLLASNNDFISKLQPTLDSIQLVVSDVVPEHNLPILTNDYAPANYLLNR